MITPTDRIDALTSARNHALMLSNLHAAKATWCWSRHGRHWERAAQQLDIQVARLTGELVHHGQRVNDPKADIGERQPGCRAEQIVAVLRSAVRLGRPGVARITEMTGPQSPRGETANDQMIARFTAAGAEWIEDYDQIKTRLSENPGAIIITPSVFMSSEYGERIEVSFRHFQVV
jgi:hypothetical protein